MLTHALRFDPQSIERIAQLRRELLAAPEAVKRSVQFLHFVRKLRASPAGLDLKLVRTCWAGQDRIVLECGESLLSFMRALRTGDWPTNFIDGSPALAAGLDAEFEHGSSPFNKG